MNEFYNFISGYVLLWDKRDPIPEGWVFNGSPCNLLPNQFKNENEIFIVKLDNLEYIEHLAKEKGLI